MTRDELRKIIEKEKRSVLEKRKERYIKARKLGATADEARYLSQRPSIVLEEFLSAH